MNAPSICCAESIELLPGESQTHPEDAASVDCVRRISTLPTAPSPWSSLVAQPAQLRTGPAACATRREGTQDLKCGKNGLRWDWWLLVPDRVQVIPHERSVLFSQEPQDGKPCGDIVNHP